MKLIFPVNLYKKMRSYVEGIDYEISGLGKVKVVKNNIYVEDIKIFRQKVTAGNTVLDRKALAKFYDEIMQQGGDLSGWKLWFHSHAEMSAFWSGTDVETIEDFDTERPEDNWLISLVTNHKAETKIRVDIFQPLRCTVEDIPWDLLFEEEDKNIRENALDEITEKVEIITYHSRFKRKSTSWLEDGVVLDEFGYPIYHWPRKISLFDKKKKDDNTNLLKL